MIILTLVQIFMPYLTFEYTKAVVTYTVEIVGGSIGQGPATEVTYLGLNQPPFFSSVGNEVKNLGNSNVQNLRNNNGNEKCSECSNCTLETQA